MKNFKNGLLVVLGCMAITSSSAELVIGDELYQSILGQGFKGNATSRCTETLALKQFNAIKPQKVTNLMQQRFKQELSFPQNKAAMQAAQNALNKVKPFIKACAIELVLKKQDYFFACPKTQKKFYPTQAQFEKNMKRLIKLIAAEDLAKKSTTDALKPFQSFQNACIAERNGWTN
jgi:hypothetical protein